MRMTLSVAGIVPEWTIEDRLRKARELTGLERGDFARELGVSRNTITNYEHGKVEPRVIVLRSWALRCGVDLSWLQHGYTPTPDPSGETVNSGWSRHRTVAAPRIAAIRALPAAA